MQVQVVSNTKGLVQSTDKKSKKPNLSARPQSNRSRKEPALDSSVDGPDTTEQSSPTQVDLSKLAEGVTIPSAKEDVVPQALPREMRSKLSSVNKKDLERLYNVEEGVERVKDGSLTHVELIVLHWRSYRNILMYDLSDFQELRTRFLHFFSSIFADLVELYYPTPEARQGLVSS